MDKRFPTLGIRIYDSSVELNSRSGRVLGPLAGAQAQMGEPSRHHRVAGPLAVAPVLGPLAFVGSLSKKSKNQAYVVFSNGTVHTAKLDGKYSIRTAEREVIEFNALANAQL